MTISATPLSGAPLGSGLSAYIDSTQVSIARPQADLSLGGWKPSRGASLSAMLNETTPDDSSYIHGAAGARCEIGLSTTTAPGSAVQCVEYRASSSTGTPVTVSLWQSGAQVASWAHALTPTDRLYVQALTADQIALLVPGVAVSVVLVVG